MAQPKGQSGSVGVASELYNGGTADGRLQELTSEAAVLAAIADETNPLQVIDFKGFNQISPWLMNETPGASCTIKIWEFEGKTPAKGGVIESAEIVITTTDQTGEVDRSAWGLDEDTEVKPKAPFPVEISPENCGVITLVASSTGDWYSRYKLDYEWGGSHTTADISYDYDDVLLTEIKTILEDINGAIGGGGLPNVGDDATGQNAYETVVSAPSRECHYLHVAVEDNGAVISCNGGSNDHFQIPANTSRLFSGLVIASGADIQAKNLVTDNNYTNVRISVW